MIIDMHVHTKEISACGHVAVKDVIELYHAKGYDAIVITNHLSPWSVGIDETESWEAFIDSFIAPVKEGREYAEKYGMKVFFGCELRFKRDSTVDFLLYGVTEKFLKAHPDILDMSISQFSPIAHENGILIYQAHPFRDWMQIIPPQFLDGVEINNGHPRHNSRNDIARLWADVHDLAMISGSDFHDVGDEGHGGIVSFRDINSESELCELLLSDDFKLLTDKNGGLKRNK